MTLVSKIKFIRIKFLNAIRSFREKLSFLKRRCFVPEIPKNYDEKVYVNLGCGVNTASEFINVDTRPFPHTHFIHEVEELSMFADDSVDLLYASHILEHISLSKLKGVLKEWYRVLKKEGILRFGVPDFDGLVEIYKKTGNDTNSIVNQLMGGEAPYDDHHSIWNYAYAEKILREIGFKEVRRWDPKKIDHHDFIDKTMRTFKIGGEEISISLNIEATK